MPQEPEFVNAALLCRVVSRVNSLLVLGALYLDKNNSCETQFLML